MTLFHLLILIHCFLIRFRALVGCVVQSLPNKFSQIFSVLSFRQPSTLNAPAKCCPSWWILFTLLVSLFLLHLVLSCPISLYGPISLHITHHSLLLLSMGVPMDCSWWSCLARFLQTRLCSRGL
ncbi:hypothetical protein B0H10DRAFT_2021915 [Mycena sp. CBHHK59/15]|nr:hypothetical protein B0H10DRAFT_2021915 [Mycena sp. CBHHK59/15]